jgi:anti-sigma regulatory factor (Ser/Thr protein kinase)/serine/threonine protein phosphatase PrpC
MVTLLHSLAVATVADVAEARRRAREFARHVGFEATECEEIGLVMSEVASNLLRHAGGGTIELRHVDLGQRPGLEIVSEDHGPGIADTERALTDGFSTAGSLGYGLGVVNRLMDELHIESQPGAGTRLVCRRWLHLPGVGERICPLAFGAASRPRPGMEVNGDAFVIKQWGMGALVGVIDGLGHGQFAHRAAQAARSYVEAHFDRPLEEIFRGAARACQATRGVVMALAQFHWVSQSMSFGSIGDIEARVFGSSQPMNFKIRRGVLGLSAPAPEVTTHPWLPSNTMVLHSDGVKSRWGWDDFPQLAQRSATDTACILLRALAKENDDATVVVVRDRVV